MEIHTKRKEASEGSHGKWLSQIMHFGLFPLINRLSTSAFLLWLFGPVSPTPLVLLPALRNATPRHSILTSYPNLAMHTEANSTSSFMLKCVFNGSRSILEHLRHQSLLRPQTAPGPHAGMKS